MTETGMEALTDPYYEALKRGELVVQHCKACNHNIMYPRHLCPFCYETDLSWVPSSGRGVLHSFAVQRLGPPSGFENDLPYAVGVVKLDDGVQLLGRLWPDPDGEWSGYSCDGRVEFHGADAAEIARRPVPWFRRAD
ncbi:Zn-ribbon domain-containing OB-fold protein [Protofrankia coriariae]|nr:OB-fold domain-containing protein [Protofrankia coriariae]